VTSIDEKAFSGCSSLKFIITENTLLLDDLEQQKRDGGIDPACEIITPSALLAKPEVQEKLSSFDDLELTNEQKVFLYVNKDRWTQFSIKELREHLGDAPLELVKKTLGEDKWEKAKKVKELAVGVLGKVGCINVKSHELKQALAQSSSFIMIKNLTLWEMLAQTAKPGNNDALH